MVGFDFEGALANRRVITGMIKTKGSYLNHKDLEAKVRDFTSHILTNITVYRELTTRQQL